MNNNKTERTSIDAAAIDAVKKELLSVAIKENIRTNKRTYHIQTGDLAELLGLSLEHIVPTEWKETHKEVVERALTHLSNYWMITNWFYSEFQYDPAAHDVTSEAYTPADCEEWLNSIIEYELDDYIPKTDDNSSDLIDDLRGQLVMNSSERETIVSYLNKFTDEGAVDLMSELGVQPEVIETLFSTGECTAAIVHALNAVRKFGMNEGFSAYEDHIEEVLNTAQGRDPWDDGFDYDFENDVEYRK